MGKAVVSSGTDFCVEKENEGYKLQGDLSSIYEF